MLLILVLFGCELQIRLELFFIGLKFSFQFKSLVFVLLALSEFLGNPSYLPLKVLDIHPDLISLYDFVVKHGLLVFIGGLLLFLELVVLRSLVLNLADLFSLFLDGLFDAFNHGLCLLVVSLNLGIRIFLLGKQSLLSLDFFSKLQRFLVKIILFLVLLHGLALGIVDLASDSCDVVGLLDNILFVSFLLLFELFVFVPHVLKSFFLFFLIFLKVFKFVHQLAEFSVFIELTALLLEASKIVDLDFYFLNLLALLLFFLFLVGNIFVAFLHFGLELSDLLDFVVGHS